MLGFSAAFCLTFKRSLKERSRGDFAISAKGTRLNSSVSHENLNGITWPCEDRVGKFCRSSNISSHSTSCSEPDCFLMEIRLSDIRDLTLFIRNIFYSLYGSLRPRCKLILNYSVFSDFLAQTVVFKSAVLTLCANLLGNLKTM